MYIWNPSIINQVIAADKTAHFADGGAAFVAVFAANRQTLAATTSRSGAARASMPAVARKAGGAVAAGGAWFGGGLKNGAQNLWRNPLVRGEVGGCGYGLMGGLGKAVAITIATGVQPEVGVASLAMDCALGASAGYLNAARNGSGMGVDAAGAASDSYETYIKYRP